MALAPLSTHRRSARRGGPFDLGLDYSYRNHILLWRIEHVAAGDLPAPLRHSLRAARRDAEAGRVRKNDGTAAAPARGGSGGAARGPCRDYRRDEGGRCLSPDAAAR